MKCSIQVLVFVISLVMVLAMSIDELEDFSNFLKETSLLDQPLKKNPTDEDDDDVPVSDHAWEESGRFEGDLILNDRQRQLIVQDIAEGLSRNGLKDSTKRWPNNEVIFYIQKEHFTGDQVEAILSGIEELSQASCVKFRPYKKGDRDAVVVQGSRRGCFSQVGYQGGYQVLNLSGRHPVGRGCFRHGTVVHEFLHTLGFYHMQSSPDRDDYIDVIWENIVQPARHNFRKYNLFSVSDFGVGYDYDSVLHYSRKAFSSNGGDTLVPKQSGAQIGQRVGLSEKDSAKLNKMYCDADSNNFEAADDVQHTLVIKKKKTPKNKPFEGHGIGYHQGKTVVIKLPAAETYRLPETPSNPVFDYFSKAPQAMSPTLIEGIGGGKEISYSYKLPAGFQIVEHKIPTYRYPILFNTTDNAVDPVIKQNDVHNKNDEAKPSNVEVGSKSTEIREDFDEPAIPTLHTPKNTDTFNSNVYSNVYKPNIDYSEFTIPINKNRDGAKTDYYVNFSPALKGEDDPAINKNTDGTEIDYYVNFSPILKGQDDPAINKNKDGTKTDYYLNFSPVLKGQDDPAIIKNKDGTKTDYYLNFSPVLKGEDVSAITKNKDSTKTDYSLNFSPVLKGEDDRANAGISNFKLTRQFIEKLQLPKSIGTDSNNNKGEPFYDHKHETTEKSKSFTEESTTFGDTDSSFAYGNPSAKLEEIRSIYLLNPEYTSKEYFKNKHDFSTLYHPSHDSNRDSEPRNAQYRIFGELVPTNLNYTSGENLNFHDEKQKNSGDDDKLKHAIVYPANKPISNYKINGKADEEYNSYEGVESYDPIKNTNRAQQPSDDNQSKSYETTEKIIRQVPLVTEKSYIESSESQDAETIEKRLPAILERYVNYNNYDINTPYLFWK